MKTLVTGGTGFIGSVLCNSLARDRHEVIVLSRAPEKVVGLDKSIQMVKWDGKTTAGWGHYADGADAIVNIAGEPIAPMPWYGNRKERIRASRVNVGRALVEAVAQAKVKPSVLVQMSAIGYYGLHGDEMVTEDSPAGKDFLASVVVDWEKATAPVEALGVRRVVYRTGLVLSRAGGILPLIALPFRFFVGGRLGSGKQWMSWVHLADEVEAIRLLMTNPQARGVYNLVAPNPVRNAELTRLLGKVMHRPAFFVAPAFALKLVFGEMAELLLLGGQRVAPTRLTQLGYQFRFPTLEAALEDLYGK